MAILHLLKFQIFWDLMDIKETCLIMVTYIDRAPILDWRVVMCRLENEHQKDTCKEEIGLHGHNMFTTPCSTMNIIQGANVIIVKRREKGERRREVKTLQNLKMSFLGMHNFLKHIHFLVHDASWPTFNWHPTRGIAKASKFASPPQFWPWSVTMEEGHLTWDNLIHGSWYKQPLKGGLNWFIDTKAPQRVFLRKGSHDRMKARPHNLQPFGQPLKNLTKLDRKMLPTLLKKKLSLHSWNPPSPQNPNLVHINFKAQDPIYVFTSTL